MKNEYSGLFQFFGCYFHQDWMCESSEPDQIIMSFVSESESRDIEAVRKEILKLLMAGLAEEELRQILMDEMPCNYCYWLDWDSAEAWLNHILEILSNE
ncbi:contact-dependent growth inhibition system immunity protein [Pseudomonas citrulli]|uniref:Contact-dependent growth inhibition system immunity protein n=1 Tax=Pseudomonas citrulli TaxID=3064347 RepID=A0ABT9C3B0_9PSED|nr:contact-dependent growth inhibition system immunity protein [Pseudomonas sp. K18]MDO7897584.1 contact-dependent growth inhibition system immunity protein [Pseudomonas sp. K18]